ncbi:MAG: plasmid mobilization relaxosome protein MobC [Butyricicoccus sp.]|nr:plasmid mobilization relaxosome protein MobC [Butyricicoccus sp.]
MAQKANMTLTDYLCICGLGSEIVRIDGLDAVLSELKAQGRNLNQLTTLANMGRLTILRSDELIDKYADVCAMIRRLTKAAG